MSRRSFSTAETRTLLGSVALAVAFVGGGFVAGGEPPPPTTTTTTSSTTTGSTLPPEPTTVPSTSTPSTGGSEVQGFGFALVDGVEWEILSSCRMFEGYGDTPLDVHTLRRDGELLVVEDDRLYGTVNASYPFTFSYFTGPREGGEFSAAADVSDGDTNMRIELQTNDSQINGIEPDELGTCQSLSADFGDGNTAEFVVTFICDIGTFDDGSSAERLSLQGARSLDVTYGEGQLEGQSSTDAHSGYLAGEVIDGFLVDANFAYGLSAPGFYALGGEGEYGFRDVAGVVMDDGEGFEVVVEYSLEWSYNWLDDPAFGLTPYREAC